MTTPLYHRNGATLFVSRSTPDPLTGERPNSVTVQVHTDGTVDPEILAERIQKFLNAPAPLPAPLPAPPTRPQCCDTPMEDVTLGHDYRHGSLTFACMDCGKRITTQRP